MVDMVCERKDGLCNLCGADPHEDCPLIDLAPELAEWSERTAPGHTDLMISPEAIDEALAALDNELDAQIKCPIGSCQRHARCMYVPCRAIKRMEVGSATVIVDDTDGCESCQ
jgi:hypothetical protein